MFSMVEARRRARGEAAREPAPPVEDERARHNRIVAESLAPRQAPTFGYDPNYGGGVFQIERMGYDYAEFLFFGWNRNVRRNTKQLIEVRKGKIIARLMRMLTRQGYRLKEQGMTYLADMDCDNRLSSLQAAACSYRIALGPRASQKVLSLRTVVARTD